MPLLHRASVGIVAACALSLSVGSANADGYNAPPGYAPSYNWSGFYVGGNVGYAWGDIDWQYTGIPGAPGHISQHPNGGMFGGQFGIQHQFGPVVLGVEAAASMPFERSLRDSGLDAPFFPGFNARTEMGTVLQIGPRIGWALSNQWLIYGTGGYANIHTKSSYFVTGFPQFGSNGDAWHEGWYIGGGVEYAMTRNIILGIEYQHFDFQSKCEGAAPGNTACNVTGDTRFVDPDMDIVRLRLSYKIGDRAPERPLK